METLYFSWIDYTLFILTLFISAAIGVYYGFFEKQDKTADSYLLGGKDMNYFLVATSLVASCISSVSILAYPTEVYIFGTIYLVVLPSYLATGLFLNYTFLPVFFKLRVSSAYEYLEIRFDKTVRSVASILYTLINFLHMSFIIYGSSLAVSQMTGFDIYKVAIVTSVVCIFYTTIGGLKAVVWADALQLVVMLATLVCVFIIGIVSIGGFPIIWERAQAGERIELFNMDIDPTIRMSFWSGLIGGFFTLSAFIGTSQHTIQRFLAVRNLKEARKTLLVFIVLYITMIAVALLSGIIIYAKYYDCDPLSAGYIKRADQILAYYVLDVAKQIPGLSGLFVAALLSASLSTLSTILNTLSGLVYDLTAPLLPRKLSEHPSCTLKIITSILGLIGLVLMFVIDRLGTMLELVISLHGIYLAPSLGMFALGMLFPIANTKGTLTGVAVSIIFNIYYVIRRHMYVWNGALKHTEMKPLRVDGCNNATITMSITSPDNNHQSPQEVPWFYRISFLYFIVMGTIIVIVVSLLVSWFTQNKHSTVNLDTFSPCIRKLLKKSRRTSLVKRRAKEAYPLELNCTESSDEKHYAKYTFEL